MARDNILTRTKKKRALALYEQKRFEEAKTLLDQVCLADKSDAESWNMLAALNGLLRRYDDAIACGQRAITLRPDQFLSHSNLGIALMAKGRHEDAITSFRRALQLKTDDVGTYVNLGNSLASLGKPHEALAVYRQAFAVDRVHTRNHAWIYSNMGNVLADQGNIEEAVTCWQEALRINPGLSAVRSNLLLCLNYRSSYTPKFIYQQHLRWDETHARGLALMHPDNDPDPERRLRIGYLSSDLREHSVAYFIEPLLANHDKMAVEIFCCADIDIPDETTARLSSLVNRFHNVKGLADDEVAKMIRADGIDILVDLAGHTAHNRLPVFARKPAPVQVTYLGYPNTTGIAVMDYRFTDAWADPPGKTEHLHTETLVRLPQGFLCYAPPKQSPPVGELPAIQAGHITFGSFNYLAKTTPEVIAVWARILKALPESRLILKNKSLTDSATRERYYALLVQQGISRERVDLIGLTPSKAEHLAVYGRVDIALDTFPYNGTTTTCDALWLGVPVIVLTGQTHAARVGVSLLSQIGMPELIASSPDEYVRLAVDLAGDQNRLAQLRVTLRDRMNNSPLCDGKIFARHVEQKYREMWRKWCSDRTHV